MGDELTTKLVRLESFTFMDMNEGKEKGDGHLLNPLGGVIDSGDTFDSPRESGGKWTTENIPPDLVISSSNISTSSMRNARSVSRGESPDVGVCTESGVHNTTTVDRLKIGEGGVSGGITRGGSVKLNRTISQAVKEGLTPRAAAVACEGENRGVGEHEGGGVAIVKVAEKCKGERGHTIKKTSLASAFEEGISGGISRGNSVRLIRTLSREMRDAVLNIGEERVVAATREQIKCDKVDGSERKGEDLAVEEQNPVDLAGPGTGKGPAGLASPKYATAPAAVLSRSISGDIVARAPIKLARTISQAARESIICGVHPSSSATTEPHPPSSPPRSNSISPPLTPMASGAISSHNQTILRSSTLTPSSTMTREGAAALAAHVVQEGMLAQAASIVRSRSLSPQAADYGSVSGGLSRSQSLKLSRTISAAVKEGISLRGETSLCDTNLRCNSDSRLETAMTSVGSLPGPIQQSGSTSPRLGRPPSSRVDGTSGGSVDMAISQAVRAGLSCQIVSAAAEGSSIVLPPDCPQAHLPSPRLMEGGISGGISRGNTMKMNRTISQSVREVVCGFDSEAPAERMGISQSGDAPDVWVAFVENPTLSNGNVTGGGGNAEERHIKSIRPAVPVVGEGISSGISTGRPIRLNRTVSLDIVEGRKDRPESMYGRSSSLPSRLCIRGDRSSPEGTPKLGRSVSGGLSSRGAIRLSRTISSDVKDCGMPEFQRSLSSRLGAVNCLADEAESEGQEWEYSEGENDVASEQSPTQKLPSRGDSVSFSGVTEERGDVGGQTTGLPAALSASGGVEAEIERMQRVQTRGRQGKENGVAASFVFSSAESDTSALLSLMEQQSLQARRSRPGLFADKMSALFGKPVGGARSPGWGTPECGSPMLDARVGSPRRSFGACEREVEVLIKGTTGPEGQSLPWGIGAMEKNDPEGGLEYEQEQTLQRKNAPGQGQQAMPEEPTQLRSGFENVLEKAVARMMNLADTRHDVASEWGERRRSCQRLEAFFTAEGKCNAEVTAAQNMRYSSLVPHADHVHRVVLEMALEEKRLEMIASMEGEGQLRRLLGGIAAAFEAHNKASLQAAQSASDSSPVNPESVLDDPWVTSRLIEDRIQAFESLLLQAKHALVGSANRLSVMERERVACTRHALILALASSDAKQAVPIEEAVSRAESFVGQLSNMKVEELWEEQLERGAAEDSAEHTLEPAKPTPRVWFLGDHIRCQGLLVRQMGKGEWEEKYAVLYNTGSLCWFDVNNVGTPTNRLPGTLDVGIAAVRGVDDGVTVLLTMYTANGDVREEVLLKACSPDDRTRWCKALREVSVDALQKQVEAKLMVSPVSSPKGGLQKGGPSNDTAASSSPSFIRQLGIPGTWPFTNNFQIIPLEVSNSEISRSGETSPSVTSKTPTADDETVESKRGNQDAGNSSPSKMSAQRFDYSDDGRNAASKAARPRSATPPRHGMRFDDDIFYQVNLKQGPSPFSDYEGPMPSSQTKS